MRGLRADGRRLAPWLAVALLLAGWAGCAGTPAASAAADAPRFATVVALDGAIGPAMSRYVDGAIDDAAARRSAVVILQMDTPGGLDTAMRDIIRTILASPVPVVCYVAPGGARAASAGTYILYASNVAAMAPATNLGAATPISLGGQEPRDVPGVPGVPAAPRGGTGSPAGGSGAAPAAPQPPVPATASERKAVNDAVAYIRSLAQLRGRNADWAESAVRGAASLPAEDALRAHVVEIIARDVPDLLAQLDGRRVQVAGREVVLRTAGLPVQRVTPDWRTQLLLVLSHPTIAYGLLLAGIWGLLLEGYHPGVVLPGVVGALALLLALYGLELLAVNFAGLALMGLGVGLIITEFFMPAYGSLGAGGLAAFVIGSIILFDHNQVELQVAVPLIAGIAIAGALVIAAIAALAARARRRPVSTGAESMVGEPVEVVEVSAADGVGADAGRCVVRYGGELWNARAAHPLHPGERARITRVAGLTLWIEPHPRSPASLPHRSPSHS
ncbi:MAG TPA: nodulation protein NfeD [Steroidobacteraceae bacterium]|nr:nodulation protein NfeD [Steroidobacteraceae bacterium]